MPLPLTATGVPMRVRTLENASFLALVVLVTVTFFGLIGPFLEPVFWAAVIAVLFAPVYQGIHEWTGGRGSLASALALLLVTLLVIMPLIGVGMAVAREAVAIYDRIQAGTLDPAAPLHVLEGLLSQLSRLPGVELDMDRLQAAISDATLAGSQYAATQAIAWGQGLFNVLALFAITLYLLFFFLRDGDHITTALIRALPLGDTRERRLFTRFAEVARATVKGTIVVGVVQGAMVGLAFWALGLSAPVLWGVVTAAVSLLPAVGSALIWGPAGLYLLFTGSVVKGIVLLALGGLLIGTVDNILRPILVGRDARMPDYLVLISTLGGLVVFGLSGFVIGPVIAALFVTVWEMFTEEYGTADNVSVALVADAPAPAGPVVTPEQARAEAAAEAEPPPADAPTEATPR